ncbi:hypothetical protein D4R47_01815, partial [archaeon]
TGQWHQSHGIARRRPAPTIKGRTTHNIQYVSCSNTVVFIALSPVTGYKFGKNILPEPHERGLIMAVVAYAILIETDTGKNIW